jgi:hypothetical protein
MANGTSLAGTRGYRSYLNTADQRVFGAGLFMFQTPTGTTGLCVPKTQIRA